VLLLAAVAANRREARLRFAVAPRPSGKRDARFFSLTVEALRNIAALVNELRRAGGQRVRRHEGAQGTIEYLFPAALEAADRQCKRGGALVPFGAPASDGQQLHLTCLNVAHTFRTKPKHVAVARRKEAERKHDSRSWKSVAAASTGQGHLLTRLLDAGHKGIVSLADVTASAKLNESVLDSCVLVALDPGRVEVATATVGIPRCEQGKLVSVDGVTVRLASGTLQALRETEAAAIARETPPSTPLVPLNDDKARSLDKDTRERALIAAATVHTDHVADAARACKLANIDRDTALHNALRLTVGSFTHAPRGTVTADAAERAVAAGKAVDHRLAALQHALDIEQGEVPEAERVENIQAAVKEVVESCREAPHPPVTSHAQQRAARFRGRQRAEAELLNMLARGVAMLRDELGPDESAKRPHVVVLCGAGGYSGHATKFARAGWDAFALAKILGRRYLVLSVPEFLTSQSCPACETQLVDCKVAGQWRLRTCSTEQCPFSRRRLSKDVTASLSIARIGVEQLLTGERPRQFTGSAQWWRARRRKQPDG